MYTQNEVVWDFLFSQSLRFEGMPMEKWFLFPKPFWNRYKNHYLIYPINKKAKHRKYFPGLAFSMLCK